MKIEVLVTTMHATDVSKYNEMNIQTDAVIANQCDHNAYEEKEINANVVKLVSTDTRGLSNNRNIALVYAKGDIILFADDDQVFVDGYEKIVADAFRECPEADAIKFYCESTNKDRPMSFKRVGHFTKASKKMLMSAGVPCLAIKRKVLVEKNINFNPKLGSGQKIFCGEDTLFYSDLCKNKVSVYLSPILLSVINQGESSWFKGYTEQYFNSIGYVYDCTYGEMSVLAIVRRAFRIRKNPDCKYTVLQSISMMLEGRRKHRKGEFFD